MDYRIEFNQPLFTRQTVSIGGTKEGLDFRTGEVTTLGKNPHDPVIKEDAFTRLALVSEDLTSDEIDDYSRPSGTDPTRAGVFAGLINQHPEILDKLGVRIWRVEKEWQYTANVEVTGTLGPEHELADEADVRAIVEDSIGDGGLGEVIGQDNAEVSDVDVDCNEEVTEEVRD